jgi:hypothetical protein
MSWLSSFFIAVMTAVVTAIAGGLVAAGCVDWYRISGREGGSGYTVIAIGLLGCIAGFFAGLILSRSFGGPGPSGFFKGWGISTGAMLGLAGAAALVAWGLADIPPTINGHELDLIVEVRLPKGAEQPAVAGEQKQFIIFGTSYSPTQTPRAREFGVLDVANARQEDGRWIVPGSVRIFTTRGSRSLTIVLDPKAATGFELRLPGHPGPKYKQWSGWLPDAVAQHWPDTRISYRFHVQENIPVETHAAPDPFDALTPDSPLGQWLSFRVPFGRDSDRNKAIMKVVEARPADLSTLLLSPKPEEYVGAMNAVSELPVVDPLVIQALRDVAGDMEAQIRKFKAMSPQQPGYDDVGKEIGQRFNSWGHPWEYVHRVSGVDGRPPVEEILQLATAGKPSPQMQGVINDAQVLLGWVSAAPK